MTGFMLYFKLPDGYFAHRLRDTTHASVLPQESPWETVVFPSLGPATLGYSSEPALTNFWYVASLHCSTNDSVAVPCVKGTLFAYSY